MIKINSKQIHVPKFVLFLVLTVSVSAVLGQTNEARNRNNPYSPSPQAKQTETPVKPPVVKPNPGEVAFVMQKSSAPVVDDNRPPVEVRPTVVTRPPVEIRPTIAQTTYKIAKTADIRSQPPSAIYKIGVGDVLYVNLKNSAQASGYYTVRPDGTIDFPLAGDHVVVAEQTIDAVEESLVSGITLFPDPQVEVKVRQYGSHQIKVSGLVDNAGEKNLQREAIPIFVIKADAIVSQKATKVLITRAPLLKAEAYDLRDAATDNVLVYPGNSVEFAGDIGSAASTGAYFISGEVLSGGQKDLTYGLTLYQAVIASGGPKGDPKKAIVRRKNDKGLLVATEYNLRSIKEGRMMDPILAPGDVIEVKN